MAPSRPTSTMRMVTSILLISNVAYASVLPPNQPYLPDTIAVRAPSEDATIIHDLDEVISALNDKKGGKDFFKELGDFLRGFDPVDVFRTILGGLLGFNTADAPASTWLSTTVTIAPTPVEIGSAKGPIPIVLPTAGTTVTKKVTTTQVKKSSTKATSSKKASKSTSAEAVFSILPIFPTDLLELTDLAPTAIPTPQIIITPGVAASFSAAVSADAEIVVDVLPSGVLIDIIDDVSSIGVPVEIETLVAIPGLINATISPNATSSKITVTFEPEETFSILPFIEPGEDLSENVSLPVVSLPTDEIAITKPLVLPTALVSAVDDIIEPFEPEETFSILPFFPSGEGISDDILPATADDILPFETIEVVTVPVTDVPGATLLPVQSEDIFSILPFFPSGDGITDNILPATADDILPFETIEVVTVPVTDVPGATLLPVQSEDIFSILPFLEPGEHLSDNVSEPAPTKVVPELSIPIFTASGKPLNPFVSGDVSGEVTISVPVEVAPLPTDLAPVPLLEFVNGTYVLPTTKKPDVVIPVASWPPPGFEATKKPAVSTRRGRPRKTSSKRRARPTRPAVPSLLIPRPTKPILLPPPLVRPTNFPLNQTFFANQTKGAAIPVAKTSLPLILTKPLPIPLPRPIRPFPPFPFPIFNNTKGIRPIGRPTRPLILTNPLRTTPESFPTLKPVFNSTKPVRPDLPLILTKQILPPIETIEPLELLSAGKTTTKTLKVRSTTIKTVIVIATPASVEVSIFGVDVPSDEPLPSDGGFVGLFPVDATSILSENPRPTFPIINDFDTFDLPSDLISPSAILIADDFVEDGIPSDLVEPTAVASIVADLSAAVALSIPTAISTGIEISLPDVAQFTPETVDIGLPIEATEIPIPDIDIDPETIDVGFGVEATASLLQSLDDIVAEATKIPIPDLDPETIDIDPEAIDIGFGVEPTASLVQSLAIAEATRFSIPGAIPETIDIGLGVEATASPLQSLDDIVAEATKIPIPDVDPETIDIEFGVEATKSVLKSLDIVAEATKIPIPDIDIDPETIDIGFGVEATASLIKSLDIAIPTDVDILPVFTPTPTPRTFATLPSILPSILPSSGIVTLALPSNFPLPQPSITATTLSSAPSAQRLAEICSDAKVTTVTLPLLDKWYGANAYPSLRPYPGCVPASPQQALQAPGLLNCTELGREVQACQKSGKRVLLGVRVDAPSAVNGNLKWGSANPGLLGLKLPLQLPSSLLGLAGNLLAPQAGNLSIVKVDGKTVPAPNLFDAVHTPTGLAATLFSLFGEGHAERADLRPLGPDTPSAFSSDKIKWDVKPLGEEVVVDGFDVRTPGQWKGTAQAALVERFVGSLREAVEKAWKDGGEKKGGLNDLGVDGAGVVVSGYI